MYSTLSHNEWCETSAGLWYVVADAVQFEDDFQHWHDGFCRLLEITEATARKLIELTVASGLEKFGSLAHELPPESRLESFKAALCVLFPSSSQAVTSSGSAKQEWGGVDYQGQRADWVYAGSISGNCQRLVVGRKDSEFGWQVRSDGGQPVEAASVEYDLAYYEAPEKAHCGMRRYLSQENWRLNKARRLMGTIIQKAGAGFADRLRNPGEVRALDVGSATGYFRRAMAELGFQHYGIDLSEDAIRICRDRLGYDTWHGTLFDLPTLVSKTTHAFDVITLWDTLEHLDDPLAAVELLSGYLAANGVIVVRTPNLMASEAVVLGDHYYSFKLDHVRYFSAKSLTAMMERAGLRLVYLETTSHLLKGLVGANYLYRIGKEQRGADILAAYAK